MTIYQEEMQRKAQRYGCITDYDEADQLLLISHISISQKNKRSRHGRPTCAICSTVGARSSNAPAENTNGVTAHRR